MVALSLRLTFLLREIGVVFDERVSSSCRDQNERDWGFDADDLILSFAVRPCWLFHGSSSPPDYLRQIGYQHTLLPAVTRIPFDILSSSSQLVQKDLSEPISPAHTSFILSQVRRGRLPVALARANFKLHGTEEVYVDEVVERELVDFIASRRGR